LKQKQEEGNLKVPFRS